MGAPFLDSSSSMLGDRRNRGKYSESSPGNTRSVGWYFRPAHRYSSVAMRPENRKSAKNRRKPRPGGRTLLNFGHFGPFMGCIFRQTIFNHHVRRINLDELSTPINLARREIHHGEDRQKSTDED
jgi:hypothetical protein